MLGAVLAIIVVTATLTFGASLNTLISHPGLYGWNFDYALYSTDGYRPVPSRVVQPLLARDTTVASTTGVYFATVEIDGQVVPLLAEPAHAAIAPPVLSGHRLNGPGQVVLGSATLAELHKRVGDTVVVRGDGIPAVRLRVVGTATLPTIGEVISVHPTMSTGALIPTSAVPPRSKTSSARRRARTPCSSACSLDRIRPPPNDPWRRSPTRRSSCSAHHNPWPRAASTHTG